MFNTFFSNRCTRGPVYEPHYCMLRNYLLRCRFWFTRFLHSYTRLILRIKTLVYRQLSFTVMGISNAIFRLQKSYAYCMDFGAIVPAFLKNNMNARMKPFLFAAALFIYVASSAQPTYLKQKIKQQKEANKTIGIVIKSPLKTIEDSSVTLLHYKGKFLVLDFWFTKCGPCFYEFPYMDSIKLKFTDNDLLTFINICSESDYNEWKQVVSEKQIKGINLFDNNPMVKEIRLIGAPKATGKGIVHDQLYMVGYPSYAFIDSCGRVLGATAVGPSNKLLFAYYIEGLLKSRSLDESLKQFIAEVTAKKPSDEFLLFIEKRFNVSGTNAYKLIAPYRKYF